MVKKQFFDIKPSHKPEMKVVKDRASKLPPKEKRISPVYIGLSILAAAALSYFFIPQKAKVEIWPKKNNVAATTTVVIGQSGNVPNFIQGEIIEINKTVSRNFAATGKKIKSEKARGAIRVYNNYSAASQPLLAKTRFVSDDGKLFRSLEMVVVPGGSYEGGKLAAGFIDIEVIADQAGPDYNIDASTFSIPGFVGTPKYTSFYAKSFKLMSGGEQKEVPYITQKDFDDAKDALIKIAPSEIETALRDLISSENYILLDGASSVKVDEFIASAKAGEELDNFSVEVKSKSKAIAFKEKQLMDFSKRYILQKLLPEEKLIESSIKTEYSKEIVRLEKNELVLKLAISAEYHAAPNEADIKEMVRNKNIKEVQNLLKGISQLERARVEFWPFWVNLAPNDQDRIKIILRLD